MGLIAFVKNAGAKLFGKKEKAAADAPELTQQELDAQKALELENLVRNLGLDIQDLFIEVNDDVATIHGQSETFEVKEKAAIAIGNVSGIANVDDRIVLLETEPIGPANEESADEEAVNEETEMMGQSADRSVGADYVSSQFHTVVKNDSLSKIAKKYYGNALKYPVIFEANKPMLKDPNLIYPGQVLRIPALEA
ncbi:MAG: peptidoglycan-binding protein LysM [Chitinophagales bacterium]